MNLNEQRALPPLIAHLQDPATPGADLPQLMLALKRMAEPSVVEPTLAFLMLYHAEPERQNLLTALEMAVDIVAAQRGADAEPPLELVANDSFGMAPLRAYAARVLATLPRPEPEPGELTEEGDDPEAANEPADAETGDRDEAEAERERDHLTARDVTKILGPVMDPLRQCLRDDRTRPMASRLTIVLDGEGDVLLVRTLPESLQSCVEPLVLSVPFPPHPRARRQQITYRLTR